MYRGEINDLENVTLETLDTENQKMLFIFHKHFPFMSIYYFVNKISMYTLKKAYPGVNAGAPVPHVASVVVLLLQTRCLLICMNIYSTGKH